jgi:uncharacterized protein YfaS (alpha-2-macroglobulin family)
MTERFRGFLFLLFLLLNPVFTFGQAQLRVSEQRTRLVLNEGGGLLRLPVESGVIRDIPIRVELQVLDTGDRIIEGQTLDLALTRGSKQFAIPLKRVSEIGQWTRVKYRVSSTDASLNLAEARGVVSVSEIGAQPFVLRVALPRNAVAGTRCRVVVFTQHPLSGRPVADVVVSGSMMVPAPGDADDRVVKATARSNSSGYATLDFDLPARVDDTSSTIEIKARLGSFTKEVSEDIYFIDKSDTIVSTDKPIYQPGQHLRVRILAFDALRHARAGESAELSIYDPENSSVYRTELTTSPFGEADTDWVIPENARLGDYSIEVGVGDSGQSLRKSVKISRYDLPTFTVNPKTDRGYYLPNQAAQVEVQADYLFGQPLKQGHVRIVRQTDRHWNYRAQKWETNEEAPVEGELDSHGKFVATLALQEEHDRIADRAYQRYADLKYAAYVTDATTGRTEERRFDVRISKEPIHLYVSGDRQADGLPLEFYVSASYADGAPVKGRISIYEEGRAQVLQTIATNRYGVAKVTGLQSEASDLEFTADDGKGASGHYSEKIWRAAGLIRVRTDKTIYRHGDPIEVEIRSTYPRGPVILSLSNEAQVIRSTVLQLRNGKSFTVIPYEERFQDDITVTVHYAGDPGEDSIFGKRTIAYPRDRELKVDARLDKAAYAPGEEASVGLRIRTPEGLSKPSLIGLVVLDKAVEERARIDDEFGGRSGWFCGRCSGWFWSSEPLSSLSRRDLDRLDLKEPVPADIETAAEVLLNAGNSWWNDERLVEGDDNNAELAFRTLIGAALSPLKEALKASFAKDASHPVDDASLKELLSRSGLALETFRDPWGNAYGYSFSIDRESDVLEIRSAGPDKHFGSEDDFTALKLRWPYFRPRGQALDKAVNAHYGRTRHFARDLPALKEAMLQAGEDIESWTDRWGHPYHFEFGVTRNQLTITVRSCGPNGAFEPAGTFPSDDFSVWVTRIDWTAEAQDALLHVVGEYFQQTKSIPDTEAAFAEALRLDPTAKASFTDPWMRPCYVTFKTSSYYTNGISIMTYSQHLSESSQRTSIVPTTSKFQFVVLRSAGPDGVEGTWDDFDVAFVSRLMAEGTADGATTQPDPGTPILTGAVGAIRGVVTDATMAVIPGVTVTARSSRPGEFKAFSDDAGRYVLPNLPPGTYDVSFELPGFTTKTIRSVPVQSLSTTSLNVALEIGSVAQSVEVSLAADSALPLATASASIASVRQDASTKAASPMATPRLRQYFPETLVWQPAVETDRAGRAQVKFKLADNITTWKMAAVVSTVDGQIGLVEKEFVSSQPFFVEHDPPHILTQGDQIALPVVVRNYLNKDQSVNVTMHPADWFELLNGTARSKTVKSGEASREVFSFKAVKSTNDGKQRVTATGSHAGDSVEKPVIVRPDGKEMVNVWSEMFRKPVTHSFTVPSTAIPNTAHAELRIYPNLVAHVIDGIEGILQRPYGCGEQTISSAYPSLILLRYFREHEGNDSAVTVKAQRYLQIGLDRLRAYQNADGSFTYWGNGPGDTALTAYAVQFLKDASELTPIDETAVKRASDWLEHQQRDDGSWGSPSVTALVTRALSQPGLQSIRGNKDSVASAINYLGRQTSNLEEPYALASLALAASNAGNEPLKNEVTARLQRMAHRESSGAYWDLQTNTPFYGWGLAGRLETTALVVRALAESQTDASLVDDGLLFVLRNKDRYGVWYSTHATVDVLEALMAVIGTSGRNDAGSSADILVNDHLVTSIAIPAGNQAANPITLDLSKFLIPGDNRIEIRGTPGGAASVQFLETHYVPWTLVKDPDAGSLRLSVHFDKTEAKVGDEIHCEVEAERAGFRGYGMMLAEIGLPPGADVDRASLEAAVAGNYAINRYEVLQDRLVLYLWPSAGGSRFNFKFRARYGIDAQTPASSVYDYYNPEAQFSLKPVRFVMAEN